MDEKGPDHTPEGIPAIEVRNPRVDYAEEQDRKRREFEEEQERRRREFEAAMERKKAKRDWLTVVFAGIAAACAIWAAYEAYDAGRISRKSLDVQQQSVNAQIEAMRRADQPFVYPKGAEWEVTKYKDGFEVFASVTPVISGKTPALSIKVEYGCKAVPVNTEVELPFFHKRDIEIAFFSFDEPSQRPLSILCSDDKGNSLIKIDHTVIFLFGEFTYQDLFTVLHHTPFCFSEIVYPSNKHGKLETCTGDFPRGKLN